MKKTIAGIVLCAGFIIGAMGLVTSSDVAAKTKKVTVKQVKVKEPYAKKAIIAKGKKIRLVTQVNVKPSKKAYQKVKYSSKNKKIATVDKKGVVKARKVGSTKIVVTSVKNKKKRATIAVKVVKFAVKKVSLSGNEISTFPGSRFQMKAKVSVPSKKKGSSSKILYWTTSNKNVATVSQKGIVKAKNAGTAKITVKAIDGSGKKAVCKVTVVSQDKGTQPTENPAATPQVPEPLKIVDLNYCGGTEFCFSLNQPKELKKEDVVMEVRKSDSGNYHLKLSVIELATDDNQNYIMTVGNYDNYYNDGYYLRLSLPGFSDAVWEEVNQGVVGNYHYQDMAIFAPNIRCWESICHNKAVGYCNVSVKGLPGGFDCKKLVNGVVITGLFLKEGVYPVEVTIEDELGSTFRYTRYYIVYSANAIQAAVTESYVPVCEGKPYYVKGYVTAKGGSGNYTYTIGDNPYGLTITEEGCIKGSIKQVGTITVPVTVTDAANPALSTEIMYVCHAEQGKILKGKVIGADGRGIENGNLWYRSIGKDGYPYKTNIYLNSDGSYELVGAAGEYDIYAEPKYSHYRSMIKHYVLNENVEAEPIQLPLYSVRIADVEAGLWYDNEGRMCGYGSLAYLPAGTHTIHTKTGRTDFLNPTIKEVTVTITNCSLSGITPTEKTLENYIIQGALGQNTVGIVKDEYTTISFIPAESGTYRFRSEGNYDTYGYLYDSEAKELAGHDDVGNGDRNFQIDYVLEAGKTYYLGVKSFFSSVPESEMIVRITKLQ